MEAKQQNVAVLHHVVPTFGVQAARLPDLGGGAQPGQIGETHHLGPDKPLARNSSQFKLATNRQDFKVRSGAAWETKGEILTAEARR